MDRPLSTLPQSKYRPLARRRTLPGWRTALTLALVLAIPALLLFKGWRLYSLAQQLRGDAAAIQTWAQAAPDQRALVSLGPLLSQARADAADLHSEAEPLLLVTPYLG